MQIEHVLDLCADLQKRLDTGQLIITGVHVAADGADALGHRQFAILHRARNDLIDGLNLLEFAPQGDALQQGA